MEWLAIFAGVFVFWALLGEIEKHPYVACGVGAAAYVTYALWPATLSVRDAAGAGLGAYVLTVQGIATVFVAVSQFILVWWIATKFFAHTPNTEGK